MKKILVGILAVIVVLGGGISVYAYESPAVTNGTPLYGLKRAIENVEGSFATTDQGKAQFHLQMALRRLEESKVLAKNGTVDQGTITQLQQEAQTALQNIQNIQDPNERMQILALFREQLQNNLSDIEQKTGSGSIPHGNKNERDSGAVENGNKNANETGSGSVHQGNEGQERSSEVNKGQQGEYMKELHANENASFKAMSEVHQNVQNILEEVVQEQNTHRTQEPKNKQDNENSKNTNASSSPLNMNQEQKIKEKGSTNTENSQHNNNAVQEQQTENNIPASPQLHIQQQEETQQQTQQQETERNNNNGETSQNQEQQQNRGGKE